ncbi:hypothetical protein Zm00014a_037790 [Zea mays]|uniref:Uncharacterized protein n=1 Tax=Zea mays TaxID=4577 RepID=A0A3L6E6Z3_MAIZE|nr:hypothetical protein Zm00014a_037790 [Zea mays]
MRNRSSQPSGKQGSQCGTWFSGGCLPAAAKLSHPSTEPQPGSLLGRGFGNGTSLTAATNWASSTSAPEQSNGRVGSAAPGKPPSA